LDVVRELPIEAIAHEWAAFRCFLFAHHPPRIVRSATHRFITTELRRIIGAVARLRMSRERVEKMLAERVRVGEDLDAKIKVAEKAGGYSDWLHLFEVWRNDTITELKAAYEGKDIAFEFQAVRESWSTHPHNSRASSPKDQTCPALITLRLLFCLCTRTERRSLFLRLRRGR
jgi:hypothetical protein